MWNKLHCLLLVMAISLTGCEQIVLDASDPLENRGAFSVNKSSVSIDTITSGNNISAATYAPSGSFSEHSLPLVILLPGFGANYGDYEAYATHLASHGYVVIGMNYVETSSDSTIANHDHKAQQVIDAIDYALYTSSIGEQIDSNKIAAMGHSLGGKLAFYAAALDARIKAVVAMDPVNAGGPPCPISPSTCANYPVAANPNRGHIGVVKDIQAASLIFRSNPDALTNPEAEFNASYFFYGSDGAGTNGTPAPSFFINMAYTPHAYYMPTFISVAPALVKRFSLAWLETVFDGTDYSLYFTGAKMQADLQAVRVVSYDSRGSY